MAIDRSDFAVLCDARDKLCNFCKVPECEKCIVTQLINDAAVECGFYEDS